MVNWMVNELWLTNWPFYLWLIIRHQWLMNYDYIIIKNNNVWKKNTEHSNFDSSEYAESQDFARRYILCQINSNVFLRSTLRQVLYDIKKKTGKKQVALKMVNLTSENCEFDPHNPQLWPHWPHGILWIPRGPSARVLQHCWREWLAFLRRLHVNDRVSSLTKIVKRGMLMFDMFWYGYGSIAMKIPLNKGVIHIHKSQLFWCELQGYYWFWHTAAGEAASEALPTELQHRGSQGRDGFLKKGLV